MSFSRFCFGASALVASVGICLFVPAAAAEESASSSATFGAPSTAAASALGVSTGPNPAQGVAVGGWMLYPSLMAGAVFNDNIYQRQFDRVAGVGIRVRPAVDAFLDNGIHKTNAYFMADVQAYPGLGESLRFLPRPLVDARPTNVTGRAGAAHTWEPMADLTVRLSADYTRQNGVFGSNFGVGPNTTSLLSANTISASQQYTNQYSGYVSVEKKLAERWFLRGTTGVQYITYDSRPRDPWWGAPFTGGLGNNSLNGLNYTGSIRAGGFVTPQIYAFVEPGADIRFYQDSWADTNGYRVVGGLGSDMISLFRGEIYGGYQSQTSARGFFGTTGRPAFGARVFYYPTQYLKFTTSVDQTLSSAATQPTATAFGLPLWAATQPGLASASSTTLQARIQGDYALSQYWTAYARAGYGETQFSIPWSKQNAWTAGAGLNYNFWRNISMTLEYQFGRTFSTDPWGLYGFGAAAFALNDPFAMLLMGKPSGFTQNIVSAGLTYRY